MLTGLNHMTWPKDMEVSVCFSNKHPFLDLHDTHFKTSL